MTVTAAIALLKIKRGKVTKQRSPFIKSSESKLHTFWSDHFYRIQAFT
nr:hypothetical protein [Nostoc sp. ChiSLP03a]MDZ8212011.1 hypothetical protein [Nostoc sp. ChiSLP03a]